MATKDCKICGLPLESHTLVDMTHCVEAAGYDEYTAGDDASALALAKELGLLQSIGQPHQDKAVFQIYFKGSKTPVETRSIAKAVYGKCLTKIKPQNKPDTVTTKGPFKKGKSSFSAAYSSDVIEDEED